MSTELTKHDGGEVSVVQLIEKIAATPNLTLEQVSVIEKLVALQERQDAQRRRERFFEALRLCQSEMPRVQKNGLIDPKGAAVPYAKLEDLDACIRKTYEKHGFSVIFDAPMVDGGKIRNVARFTCAGHTEPLEITAGPSTRGTGRLALTDAQKIKQTITECRRHLLEMFFNVIEEGADNQLDDPLITQDQADAIYTALDDIGAKADTKLRIAFYKTFGVTKVEELRESQLKEVWARIENQRRREK